MVLHVQYIERIFQKTVTSLQNYEKMVKTSPCFKFVGMDYLQINQKNIA